jgi:hypothetical protein
MPDAMRRFLRILLNAATVLSLLLCVASTGLWIRSHWVAEGIVVSRERLEQTEYRCSGTMVWFSGGTFCVQTTRFGGDADVVRAAHYSVPSGLRPAYSRGPAHSDASPWWKSEPSARVRQWGGVETAAYTSKPSMVWLAGADAPDGGGVNLVGVMTFHALIVPLWMIVVATSALPGWILVRWAGRRLTKRRAGFCLTCNYDLRATPDRCPECGAVPLAKDARLPGLGG